MTAEVEVVELSRLWQALPGVDALARRAIGVSLETSGARIQQGAEVGVHLADDAHVRALNAQWRGLDKATNVLSFPAGRPRDVAAAAMLGDVVLAFETIRSEADDERKSLADHVAHLVVHGFLHLLGYDHQSMDEAEAMEALEAQILARMGIADPYGAGAPLAAAP